MNIAHARQVAARAAAGQPVSDQALRDAALAFERAADVLDRRCPVAQDYRARSFRLIGRIAVTPVAANRFSY